MHISLCVSKVFNNLVVKEELWYGLLKKVLQNQINRNSNVTVKLVDLAELELLKEENQRLGPFTEHPPFLPRDWDSARVYLSYYIVV